MEVVVSLGGILCTVAVIRDPRGTCSDDQQLLGCALGRGLSIGNHKQLSTHEKGDDVDW